MWWQKILFVLAFTAYCFIFYNISYYLLTFFHPALLRPAYLTGQDFSLLTGIFTLIVILAFFGANYIVYGNATGRNDRY